MKTIRIEVPPNGTSIKLVLRDTAATGQAVVVASDDVDIVVADPPPPKPKQPIKTPAPTANGAKPVLHDLDTILKRLTKLKPTKRATAVNSIKAMFQFSTPINDTEASKILEALRKRGDLSIDASGKLQIRKAEQGGAANRWGRSVSMLSVTPTRHPRSTLAPAPAVG